jgi:serine/threonine-protein kinase
MADVYLATAGGPLGVNKLVVIKRLRTQLTEDSAVVGMFIDEARLASRLNHPNVIHTYEVGDHAGMYFIVMEYLDGQPLNRIVHRAAQSGRGLSPSLAVRIAVDALAGLHYAHELRDYDDAPIDLVHRDISPHNIFVTYDGQVKVVDFGIAKAALSRTTTEVGTLKGKVAYMSPEQATGASVDRRSDLFSMGTVLWEMLAGRRLFGGETAAATLHRVLNGPIAPLASLGAGVDPGLEAIVAKALDRDRTNRFPTAQEFRQALLGWSATARVAEHEEVGRFVHDLFKEVRGAVNAQIRAHMASLSDDSRTHGAPVLGHVGEVPFIQIDADSDSGRSGASASNVRQATRRLPTSTGAVEVPRPSFTAPSKRTLVIGTLAGSAVAVGLLTASVLLLSRSGESSSAAVPASMPASVPAETAAAQSASTPASIAPGEPSNGGTPSVVALPAATTTTTTAPAVRGRTWVAPRSWPAAPAAASRAAPASTEPGPTPVFAPPPKPTVRSLDTSDPWAQGKGH